MRINFIIILSLSSLTLFCQNNSCVDFKIGEFKFLNPNYSEWTITRNDSIQTEINSKTGVEIKSVIKWKSECVYTLTCKSVSKPELKNAIGKIFEVSIIKTYNNGYTCISRSNDIQLKDLELEMIKTK